jgi:outer membrane lipoprotein-sorting protein
MTEFEHQESEFIRRMRETPFDDSIRVEHRDALCERVLQKFDQANAAKPLVRSPKQALQTWRNMMRRPIPRMIAIIVICLTITAPWLFFPAHQTKAFGFNNLAAALVEAKTAKFQLKVTIEGPVGAFPNGLPTQTNRSYYRAPGKYRTEITLQGTNTISISDDTDGRILMLNPATKTAMITVSKGKPKDQPSNDPFARLRDLLSKNRDQKENSFKPIGEKNIDGHQAVGFRSISALGEYTLWGDSKTGHPVQVEVVTNGTPRTTVVMTDFEMNIELDESLFAMTPPADYKIQSIEVDLSPVTEKNFIDALTRCSKISSGNFPDDVSMLGPMLFVNKHSKERLKELEEKAKNNSDSDELQKLRTEFMKDLMPIQRGFRFVLELPESADAHYAGKGAKHGTKDRAIFWYKPQDSTKYRVIYADLSVNEADKAPDVPSAVSVFKQIEAPIPENK